MKKKFREYITSYFWYFARSYLVKYKVYCIGVTGSFGKSSTVDAIYQILKDTVNVKKTINANSEIGIPLDVFGFHTHGDILEMLKYVIILPIKYITSKKKFDVYVIEMGVDHPGDMEYLMNKIPLDIGILVSIGKVHTENFNGEDREHEIYKEKSKIITMLQPGGRGIINADIPYANDIRVENIIKISTKDNNLKYYAYDIQNTEEGFSMKTNDISLNLPNYILTKSYAYNFLSALAVGDIFEIDKEKQKKSISNFKLPPSRMTLFNGIKKSKVIDSSYNASANPTIEILQTISHMKFQRKIFVFGDMRELGQDSKKEHERVAQEAVKDIDYIITIGEMTKKYFIPEAIRLGFDKNKIKSFENSPQASEFIKGIIREKDLIIVKGSQNEIFTEIVVENIINDNKNLICRRGKYWEAQRQKSIKPLIKISYNH
jgi:UDP-N-acetylmuramoyl-tripeptide--D-alanyl-D-alanine ligase